MDCYGRVISTFCRADIVSVVVTIDKLSILVTVLFSYLFFKEKLSKKAAIGLCLMVAAVLGMALFT